MNISIIGQGFVGLSLSVVLGSKNFSVNAIENNFDKLSQLRAGKSPFYEPKLNFFLKKSLKTKKLQFFDSIKNIFDKTNIIFITVPTPNKNGKIDLTYIENVIKNLIPLIDNSSKKITIVIKSTIAPGTTEKFIIPLLSQSKKKIGKDFFLAINPEFLREGFAIDDQLNPHVVVIGCQNNETMKILKNFYQKIYPKKIPIVFTNYATAELIKYSNNAFLATKISFINSISNLCQTIPGSNVDEVAKVIGMDPRIGSLFLKAGPGFGGSCLPKDLNALISVLKDNKVNSSLFESVQKINDDQIKLILSILKKNLNNLTGKNISILGLAFKENSDDIRESKSIILIKELLLKKCKINAYDLLAISNTKKIFGNKIFYSNSISKCIKQSDAIIIMNSDKEFIKISEIYNKKMKIPLIIDTRRILKQTNSMLNHIAIGINDK